MSIAQAEPLPTDGPLRRHPDNPRWFATAGGRAVVLVGSHTWHNLQDIGPGSPPKPFDAEAYLEFLTENSHNFIRLWRWELTSWDTSSNRGDTRMHNCSPHPWTRTGPGKALDGKPRFDLTEFNEKYFARLRERISAARERGIYVSIMLFEGWGMQFVPEALSRHPFHPENNINGIGAGLGGEKESGHLKIHELEDPEILAIQETYVRHVIDTVNEFDNVLFEISNENHPASTDWQYHMIDLIHEYEKAKPLQHPVGMTFQHRGGSNQTLLKSPADWISPNPQGGYKKNPPPHSGEKVILNDTDHLWGIGGNAGWVWQSFLRGHNPIFMDPYDGIVLGTPFNNKWTPIRKAMGTVRQLSREIDLGSLVPMPKAASKGYCLADPGKTYIAFQPDAGKPFSITPDAGRYSAFWLDPVEGTRQQADELRASGGREYAMQPPAPDLAVLVLKTKSPRTVLGIQGSRFTINNRESFLLGISYYGALGATRETIIRDLDAMQRRRINWLRVWATWGAFDNEISAVTFQGEPRRPFLDRLYRLVAECDRRGMIVDVTLSRGKGNNGKIRLRNEDHLVRAALSITEKLREYRNWYLDLANERNIRDSRFVSFAELKNAAEAVRKIDPSRLITASHAGGDLGKDNLKRYLEDVKVSFLAPHRPRNPDSPGQTAANTRKLLQWSRECNRTVPIHFQEPFRRGYRPDRWNPPADAFLEDLRQAVTGGAAGWCLHNGDQKNAPDSRPRRSFDLRDGPLFDQLDKEELSVADRMYPTAQ